MTQPTLADAHLLACRVAADHLAGKDYDQLADTAGSIVATYPEDQRVSLLLAALIDSAHLAAVLVVGVVDPDRAAAALAAAAGTLAAEVLAAQVEQTPGGDTELPDR